MEVDGLVYGAGHAGLELNLKYKKLRNFTLWNWRNLNFSKYAGFNKEKLNKVLEAQPNGSSWDFKTYDAGLFD